jgi:uncharacterized membrane protein
LTIENVSPAGDCQTTEVPTAWAQVELTPRDEPEMRSRQRQKIVVRSHGQATEIGGFLHPAEMPKLAFEVKRMISKAREAALTEEETPAGGQLNTTR